MFMPLQKEKTSLESILMNRIEMLIEITLKEREAVMALDGKSLFLLTKQKKDLTTQVMSIVGSGKVLNPEVKDKLSQLIKINQLNKRLLQTVIQISAKYKAIFSGTPMITGTYAKTGTIESVPLSMKVNMSA